MHFIAKKYPGLTSKSLLFELAFKLEFPEHIILIGHILLGTLGSKMSKLIL